MGWTSYSKKRRHEPTLTEADRKRIAAIDENPLKIHQRYQVGATFSHPDVEAVIYLRLYGKDEQSLKLNIAAHLAEFQKADSKWKCTKSELLKSPDMNPFQKTTNEKKDNN